MPHKRRHREVMKLKPKAFRLLAIVLMILGLLLTILQLVLGHGSG